MDKFLVKHLFYFKLSAVINFIIFLSISDTFSDPINLIGNISGNYCETADQYTMRNCRIPSGTTCFFGPGCVIKIDDTAGIICDGNLVIKGTALKPVIFEPIVNTYTWKGIAISTSGRVNLSFGNFIRAKDGISFSNVSPGNISNCKFINCLNSSIIGYCQGYVPCASPYESDRPISIGLVVQRCSFIDGAGCKFYSNGVCRTSSCMGSVTTFNIDIFNSLFINSPTGIYLQKGQCAFTTLKANNNVYLKCDTAVTASIGCEFHILNSLFVNNSIALFDSANTVNTTDYSCFYNNDTNIIGSSSLGRIIPDSIYICQRDFTYNIFCDPLIKDTLNCILDSLSPCIDHGKSDSSYFDNEMIFAFGSSRNDIGNHGGPFNKDDNNDTVHCSSTSSNALKHNFRNQSSQNYFKLNTMLNFHNNFRTNYSYDLNGSLIKNSKNISNKMIISKSITPIKAQKTQ